MQQSFQHVSVLKSQTIQCVMPSEKLINSLMLQKKQTLIFCDATLGGGGHAVELIQTFQREASLKKFKFILLGFDKDDFAIERSKTVLTEARNACANGFDFFLFHTSFANIDSILKEQFPGEKCHGFYADLGVSSFQLDDSLRGFSLSREGPIDMRMDNTQTLTAKDILLNYSQEQLEQLFFDYGEEPKARKLAKKIVMDRFSGELPLDTTASFACYVKKVLAYPDRSRVHPATRVFQALRIEVNQELSEIGQLVGNLPELMHPYGKAAFISFHSLEDRMIKKAMRNWQKGKTAAEQNEETDAYAHKSPFFMGFHELRESWGKEEPRGGIVPNAEECERNPRARSARLRCFEFLRPIEEMTTHDSASQKD